MKRTNLSTIAVTGNGDLKVVVKKALEDNGYIVRGEIETNYNHAYAAIKVGKPVLGSAWKFMLVDDQLVIVGGLEKDLKTNPVIRELSSASRKFINSLSTNAKDGDVNQAWRDTTLKNRDKSDLQITKGTFLKIKKDRNMDIALHGDDLSRIFIADGQGVVAYTEDGRQLQLPKPLRKNYDIVEIAKATETNSDGPEHSAFVTRLLMSDICNSYSGGLVGYHMRSSSSLKNDKDQLIIREIAGESEITVAIVGGKPNMEIAIEEMKAHNALKGTLSSSSVYNDNSMDFVQIDLTKKVEAINAVNMVTAESSSIKKSVKKEALAEPA
jgi:hypothetical protein